MRQTQSEKDEEEIDKAQKEEAGGKKKEEKGAKRRTMKELRMEALARERLIEARPRREEEKYGDDGRVNFQAFRNRFDAVAKDRGANPIDVLNELPNWLRGTPKYLVEAFWEQRMRRRRLSRFGSSWRNSTPSTS